MNNIGDYSIIAVAILFFISIIMIIYAFLPQKSVQITCNLKKPCNIDEECSNNGVCKKIKNKWIILLIAFILILIGVVGLCIFRNR
jgi:hypothetical protein